LSGILPDNPKIAAGSLQIRRVSHVCLAGLPFVLPAMKKS